MNDICHQSLKVRQTAINCKNVFDSVSLDAKFMTQIGAASRTTFHAVLLFAHSTILI
jgi:hypothetical protein